MHGVVAVLKTGFFIACLGMQVRCLSNFMLQRNEKISKLYTTLKALRLCDGIFLATCIAILPLSDNEMSMHILTAYC